MTRLMKTSMSAIALLLALPACAQQAPAPKVQDADPALWVVKDEDTTIYLFGTVHVLKPGLSWFDEAVKTAFDGSKELVLELVEPDPATMQQIVMSNAAQPAAARRQARGLHRRDHRSRHAGRDHRSRHAGRPSRPAEALVRQRADLSQPDQEGRL